ncbi:MAG: sulfatase-like hydrolase/transferase [Planctomycetota bacterium]
MFLPQLAAIFSCMLFWLGIASAQLPPNVLMIVADDFGVDQLSCFGATNAAPTPNIDALATTGMRFTSAYMNPACSPSRGAMLTGRFAFRNGLTQSLPYQAPGIAPGEILLPTPLAAMGYSTALIGKWHLGSRYGNWTPNLFGWPHFAGVMEGGIADYYQYPKVIDGTATIVNRYATTDQVDDALAWIRGQSGQWCLVLSLCAPHSPYHVPPATLHTENLTGLNPATNPLPFQRAMIEALDSEIGRLLAGLSTTTLARTNVIFSGDNGTDNVVVQPPQVPSHGKGSLYTDGIHVPLIVRGPAVAVPGSTSSALISGVDLFPTILQLCGSTYPVGVPQANPIDGRSFVPLLNGTATAIRDHVYSEITGTPWGEGVTAIDVTHSLIRYSQVMPQHEEFYNQSVDPLQTNNLLLQPMSTTDMLAYQRLVGCISAIRPCGWVTMYGTGCGGSNGLLRLRAQTMPNLGNDFYLQVVNQNTSAPFIFTSLGFSDQLHGAMQLPFDLTSVGMPTCSLYASVDAFIWMESLNGYGVLPLPNAQHLIGIQMYLQSFAYDFGVNAANLLTSHGLRCVLGNL